MEDEHSKLEETAYHEAGHAVMSDILGIPIKSATIIPNSGEYLGMVKTSIGFTAEDIQTVDICDWKTQKKIEAQIMVFMAGQIAEAKYSEKEIQEVIQDDRALGEMLFELVRSQEEYQAYYDWLYIKTKNLILCDPNWSLVEAVAKELLKRKRLSGRKIRKVIQEATRNYMAT